MTLKELDKKLGEGFCEFLENYGAILYFVVMLGALVCIAISVISSVMHK